ncbi:hypothetical protein [Pseudoalteromonas luteoviolacea]|uniref:hypothetical protein n=1 Tax=Pseudoalteromonas luteoviolacea TaxID=43657 RepID=UPI0012DA8123|nr:hypothetical protein [Pseudoalteromonas luteoviolacea]
MTENTASYVSGWRFSRAIGTFNVVHYLNSVAIMTITNSTYMRYSLLLSGYFNVSVELEHIAAWHIGVTVYR